MVNGSEGVKDGGLTIDGGCSWTMGAVPSDPGLRPESDNGPGEYDTLFRRLAFLCSARKEFEGMTLRLYSNAAAADCMGLGPLSVVLAGIIETKGEVTEDEEFADSRRVTLAPYMLWRLTTGAAAVFSCDRPSPLSAGGLTAGTTVIIGLREDIELA